MVRECTPEEYDQGNATKTSYLLATLLCPSSSLFFSTILTLYTTYQFIHISKKKKKKKNSNSSFSFSFLEKLCLFLQYLGVINCLGVLLTSWSLQSHSPSLNTPTAQLLLNNIVAISLGFYYLLLLLFYFERVRIVFKSTNLAPSTLHVRLVYIWAFTNLFLFSSTYPFITIYTSQFCTVTIENNSLSRKSTVLAYRTHKKILFCAPYNFLCFFVHRTHRTEQELAVAPL